MLMFAFCLFGLMIAGVFKGIERGGIASGRYLLNLAKSKRDERISSLAATENEIENARKADGYEDVVDDILYIVGRDWNRDCCKRDIAKNKERFHFYTLRDFAMIIRLAKNGKVYNDFFHLRGESVVQKSPYYGIFERFFETLAKYYKKAGVQGMEMEIVPSEQDCSSTITLHGFRINSYK